MHVQVVHAVVLAGEHVDIASEMRQAADRLVGVAVCRRHDDRADATQRAAKVAVGVLDKRVGTPIVIEVGLGHLPTIFFRMVEVLDVCGQRTPDRGILDCGWFYIEIHRRSASDAGAGNGRQAKREGDGERESCRSEEHTSELQSLMRISYAVFCLQKTKKT